MVMRIKKILPKKNPIKNLGDYAHKPKLPTGKAIGRKVKSVSIGEKSKLKVAKRDFPRTKSLTSKRNLTKIVKEMTNV